jgi:hypothetical protein
MLSPSFHLARQSPAKPRTLVGSARSYGGGVDMGISDYPDGVLIDLDLIEKGLVRR